MSIRKEIIHQIGWLLVVLSPVIVLIALIALSVAVRSLPSEFLAWISVAGWGCIYVLGSAWALMILAFLFELVTVFVRRLCQGGAQ